MSYESPGYTLPNTHTGFGLSSTSKASEIITDDTAMKCADCLTKEGDGLCALRGIIVDDKTPACDKIDIK